MIKIFKEGKPNDFKTYNKLSKFEEKKRYLKSKAKDLD